MHALARGRDETMRCCWVGLAVLALLGGVDSWWPFGSSAEESEMAEEATATVSEEVSGGRASAVAVGLPVPFEITTAEKKFLSEAQQYLDLPPLEQCQYQVVARLRRSCGEMGEEEMGKLSVALLNCQSQAEHRPTFACTEAMSLAECTGSMDAHMWNAYHIVSNRARSVCYATRQQQFRRQTELSVNKLSSSMHEQLAAVQEIASGHEQIQTLAKDSMETMQKQQGQLAGQQQVLLNTHESMRDRISKNLHQLAQEKALIHSGQEQIVSMTEDIRHHLEEAAEVLTRQEASQHSGHEEVMRDLSSVRLNVREVWERIDNSTAHLLGVLGQIGTRYENTLEGLERINASIASLLSLVSGMDTAINSQLVWLMSQLGGAQKGLHVLTTLAGHACFLLLATLCVLFVRAPSLARVALLLLVVGNGAAELKLGTSLRLPILAALEVAVLAGNWLWLSWARRPSPPPLHLTPPTVACAEDSGDEEVETVPRRPPLNPHTLTGEPSIPHERKATRLFAPHPLTGEPLTPRKRLGTPPPLAPHGLTVTAPRTPTRRGSPAPARQCSSVTRTGLRCRLGAVSGHDMCFRHAHQ